MTNKKLNKSSKNEISKQDVQKKCEQVKIGIDVHASFAMVTRQFDDSKPQPAQRFQNVDLVKWIEKQFGWAKKVTTCYEAGPTGFWLHRELTERGVTNHVVCPTALDSRKKGVNTDQTDSNELQSRLDRFLAGNTRAMSVVTVPTLEQEQKRAITRQRQQLQKHRLSLAAQGRTLMLLHGFRRRNDWWEPARWCELQLDMPKWILQRLEIFRELILAVDKQLKRVTAEVVAAAPEIKPLGLGGLTHEIIDREVGDWQRFRNWRQVGSFAGLVGGVSASGQQKADLSITKAGNRRLRTALIEAAWRLLIHQPQYWLVKKWKHVLCNPKAHARRRKQIIVAVARQFFIDLWKWKTGKATPESLGWAM